MDVPNKYPITTSMIIVLSPKTSPGRNPYHGLRMTEAATVLTKIENPPKPAMKP